MLVLPHVLHRRHHHLSGNNQSPTSYCLLPAKAAMAELESDMETIMEAGVEEQEEMGMNLVMILLSLLGEDLGFWVCF